MGSHINMEYEATYFMIFPAYHHSKNSPKPETNLTERQPKKKRDFLGIFPKGGERGSSKFPKPLF